MNPIYEFLFMFGLTVVLLCGGVGVFIVGTLNSTQIVLLGIGMVAGIIGGAGRKACPKS